MIMDIINIGAGPIEHDIDAPCPHCVDNQEFERGDRVAFHHLIFGDQTGTIHHLLNTEPPRAVVHVDRPLRNVFWSVPIADLKRLKAVLA